MVRSVFTWSEEANPADSKQIANRNDNRIILVLQSGGGVERQRFRCSRGILVATARITIPSPDRLPWLSTYPPACRRVCARGRLACQRARRARAVRRRSGAA